MTRSKGRSSRTRTAAPGTTGRELRQEIPTPNVDEYRSLLAKVGRGPVKVEVHDSAFGLVTKHRLTMFVDSQVRDVAQILDWSGLADWVQEKIDTVKAKPGRPTLLPLRALMVGMLLGPIDSRGLLLSEVCDILHHRLNPEIQAELGITPVPRRGQQHNRERRARGAEYGRTLRAFHRMRTILDPSIHRRGRVMEWTELVKHDRRLTEEEQVERLAMLDTFANALIAMTYAALPKEMLARHDGSAGVDATPIRLHARMRGADSTIAASDPDGGVYQREGDHSEPLTRPGTRRLMDKRYFAMDVHLMVAADPTPGEYQYFPGLALAVTVDRPGVDPAGATRRMMSVLAERDHTPGYLAGDGLYTNLKPEDFQLPARSLGWELVLPYGKTQTGKQAAHHTGTVLVDGAWLCPAVTDDLADATTRFRAKEITLEQYRAAITKRNDYRMRLHAQDQPGGKLRLRCPAAGDSPTAKCVLKPRSEEPRLVMTTEDGQKFDGRPRIVPGKNIDRHHPPRVCAAETITIEAEAGAKFFQTMSMSYGSPEHTRTYNALRQSQEGYHGFAKDDAKEALGAPGRRRVPGRAAQTIFTGFILAAANLRKITQFLDKAKADANGLLRVRRPSMTKDRTQNPPGAEPPDELPGNLDPAA
ncbi:hypothetical protein [Ornithinimicrobium sp. Y1694]|uniref:hypothetical protein n=1 Tax=Ornithinimicrobium sp. Y1694 TaxID=3418590 RepID=UPI003CEBEE19